MGAEAREGEVKKSTAGGRKGFSCCTAGPQCLGGEHVPRLSVCQEVGLAEKGNFAGWERGGERRRRNVFDEIGVVNPTGVQRSRTM